MKSSEKRSIRELSDTEQTRDNFRLLNRTRRRVRGTTVVLESRAKVRTKPSRIRFHSTEVKYGEQNKQARKKGEFISPGVTLALKCIT